MNSDNPLPKLARPTWIPHWALLTGHAAHGLSWLLLILLGLRGLTGLSLPGLAWVHLVALGWLTLVSLAVMIHVMKGMADVEWPNENLARWSLLPYGLGVAGIVTGFWTSSFVLLGGAAELVGVSLAVYLALALTALARYKRFAEANPSVVRAFTIVLVMLALTALLGIGMAFALGHGSPAWLLTVAPPIHAHLGGLGWLSILVLGVSVNTVKPITGGRSPYIALHITASSAAFAAVVCLALGLAGVPWLTGLGAGLAVLGALVYLLDLALVLRRAQVRHRPPQAFLGCAALYYMVAACLGVGVLLGHAEWMSAYAFAALIGWLGQMVIAHMHHIGVRVLATLARGEEDETPPNALLTAGLSWATFASFELAIAGVVIALLLDRAALVPLFGALGALGWILMSTNFARAWQRANRPESPRI
ncbi:MAG TPA: hypothetical protein V6D47_04575 [Oscillatoriaceae cyanobacterium]